MTEELGQPGQIIDGKYRIIRLLGTGGMGAVWEGENVRIRRKVAIKLLHGSVSTLADVVTRFEREAQAAAMVGSDHICEVLDLGELPDHTRYMVMEYLDGETLTGRIKRFGRLPPAQSIPILLQILEALGAAHAAGIIHRDLKPDNIFILPQKGQVQNFVKILDFGVSKFSQLSGEAMNVTRAGAVVGTPYYMSPEQARGTSAVDQRTDVYAIGVLLYQATTGQVPYQAETFNELLFKIVLEVAPAPQTYVPDLDPEFASIIMRAMAREPEQRFQSCAEFRDALLAFQAARAQPQPGYHQHSYLPPQPYAQQQQQPPQRLGGPIPAATMALDFSAFQQELAQPQAPSNWGQPQPQMGASMPGMVPGAPGMQGQMGASMPGAQPQTMSGSSPGVQPMGSSQPGLQPGGPQMATGASWGNASGAGTAPPAKSKAPVIFGIIAAIALVGGATVAGVMFLGGSGKPAQAGGAETAGPVTPTATTPATPPPTATVEATPPPTAPPTATAEATPPTPPPTATAKATATTKATAQPPKPPASPVVKPPAPPVKPPAPPVKPPGKTPPGKPPKRAGGDLGY